jgi:hypothetical protein
MADFTFLLLWNVVTETSVMATSLIENLLFLQMRVKYQGVLRTS